MTKSSKSRVTLRFLEPPGEKIGLAVSGAQRMPCYLPLARDGAAHRPVSLPFLCTPRPPPTPSSPPSPLLPPPSSPSSVPLPPSSPRSSFPPSPIRGRGAGRGHGGRGSGATVAWGQRGQWGSCGPGSQSFHRPCLGLTSELKLHFHLQSLSVSVKILAVIDL